MPPRQPLDRNLSSPYFLVRVTDVSSAPVCQFVESWLQSDGTYGDKVGGRYGGANNPAVAVNGFTPAVNDLALCRSADGAGGLQWELSCAVPGGASSSPSSWKPPARAATTAALPANTYANGTAGVGATLTGNSNGALSAQDGVALAAGDRLLVKTESAPANNGIYAVTQVGDGSHPYILTRTTDCDEAPDLLGATVVIEEGTVNADTVWLGTADATITVGTTALPWVSIYPPTCYQYGGNPTAASSISARSTNVLNVPRGNYLVSCVATVAFSGGAGSIHPAMGRCNAGGAPATPFLISTTPRVTGANLDFTIVSLTQLMNTGDYDDDGSTATIDFSFYIVQATGAGTVISGVQQITALRVA